MNILGSLFYGTILASSWWPSSCAGYRHGRCSWRLIIAQAIIFFIHFSDIELAFLWYNLPAPAIVVVLAMVLQAVLPVKGTRQRHELGPEGKTGIGHGWPARHRPCHRGHVHRAGREGARRRPWRSG